MLRHWEWRSSPDRSRVHVERSRQPRGPLGERARFVVAHEDTRAGTAMAQSAA